MNKKTELENIFAHEISVLAKGLANLVNSPHQGHPLWADYGELLKEYEKLLKSSKKIFTISDAQGRVLKQRESEIQKLSYHDGLTALYNRAYVDKRVPELLVPQNFPLSLIIGDINGLKLINDVFGHAKGDQLILQTAKILKNCARPTDLVARWGGDEFLLLLPATSQEQCHALVEEITAACALEAKDPIAISLALGSATLVSPEQSYTQGFVEAEQRMYKKKLRENQLVRKKILEDLEAQVEKCPATCPGHLQRVKSLAAELAGMLGISSESADMKNLLLLASLHDIGNLVIPSGILCKPTNLTDQEQALVKTHSEVGYRSALAVGEIYVAEAILALHEHWDGTGYPNGLRGKDIPLISRLLAIVDAFDVMTHDQPYKTASSISEALAEIENQSGHQFDPALVKVFIQHIS